MSVPDDFGPAPESPKPPMPPLPEHFAARPPTASHFPRLFLVMIGLVVLFSLPYLAREIAYAITHGQQQAESDVAREHLNAVLAKYPETAGVYRWMAQRVAPSVVGIETTRTVDGVADERTHRFRVQPRYRSSGEGSGVIVDTDGYIITNFHVINGADTVVVKLSDGRTIEDVRIVGSDPLTDLAVLKIEAGNLVAATWGSSDELKVGDPVVAIGSPFGLTQTVTAGILSAKERSGVVRSIAFQDYLQTDAAVNPGNSGGALVNLRGQLVGINAAIIGQSFQGVSFAIPSKLAKDIYDRLLTEGSPPRGWLGVEMKELTNRLAEDLGLDDTRGVLVAAVVRGSPAAAGGIEVRDVIVRFNGVELDDPNDLFYEVLRAEVGSEAKVGLIRDGKEIERSVTIATRPESLQ